MLYLAGNLAALLGIVGILYLTGWLLEQRYPAADGSGRGLAGYRFGVGAAVWMGLVFILASVQMLRPLPIALLMLLVLALVWRRRRMSAGLFGGIDPFADARPGTWEGRILGVSLSALLVILWLQNQWPMVAWDADAYHLTIPRLFLEHGGFYRIPFNVYSNWPLNTQLLYTLALMARGFVAAKLLHFAFGVVLLVVVYRLAAQAARPWAGWVAVALVLLNPVVLDEIRVAYVDLAYAFFLLLSFAWLHRALEVRANPSGLLWRAGMLAGVAAGVKPTGVLGVACLVVVFLFAAVWRRESARWVVGGLYRLLVPVVVLLMPWVIKSWVLTGNPVYPFFYEVFGGPEWSSQLSVQLGEWQRSIGMGRGWRDYLLLPVRVILESNRGYEAFDGSILRVWVVLIPLAAAMCRGRALIGRCLAMAALYFVTWAMTSQQMRFLIPMLPFLAVAAAVALDRAAERLSPTGGRGLAWGTTLVLVGMVGLAGARLLPQAAEMLGQMLRQGTRIEAIAVHPVFRFIDEELPDDAKLMFLNTNHGFFCRREFVADSFFEASQIQALLTGVDDAAGIDRVLTDLGITHLLIENRDRYVDWPEALYDYLNDRQRVRRLFRSSDNVYDVVAIVSAASQARS